jgi:hypothetical protein
MDVTDGGGVEARLGFGEARSRRRCVAVGRGMGLGLGRGWPLALYASYIGPAGPWAHASPMGPVGSSGLCPG